VASPYRIALRYDRGTIREYVDFSWPLLAASASSLVIAQGSILVGESELGLAAAGAIALAGTITAYAERIDQIITFTLYPAICAVRDRLDLLFETFVKSNRLALMWSLPFGVGLALFAPDLVEFGIGEQWRPAVFLLQVFGLNTALYQVGFNWNAFFQARGETRPMAIVAFLTMVAFGAAVVPLTVTDGLDGFAIGMAIMTVVNFAARAFFLTRLFPAFQMATHAARAAAPTVPAVAAVLLLRALGDLDRTLGLALGELAVFVGVTVAATAYFERALLRELLGYLRQAPAPEPGVAT
jgi:O-antigen/teichoic acid export membrane protein